MPALPPADELRRKAAEVLARPEYDEQVETADTDFLYTVLMRILGALESFYESLKNLFSFLPAPWRGAFSIILLILLVFFIARILLRVAKAVRPPDSLEAPRPRREKKADPEDLEREAEAAHAAGRSIEAVRLLFRAGLLRIEQAERKGNRPGVTNREILRKYRATPLVEPITAFVDTIDLKWYGGRPAAPDDFDRCRSAYDTLRAEVRARVSENSASTATAAATPPVAAPSAP